MRFTLSNPVLASWRNCCYRNAIVHQREHLFPYLNTPEIQLLDYGRGGGGTMNAELGKQSFLPALGRRQFLQTLGATTAAVSVGGLAACSSTTTTTPQASSGKPRYGGTLRIGEVGTGTTETLDPATNSGLIGEARDRNLYDTLTFFKPDWALDYCLAESFEPNANATQFQLKLRPGVTFHNGKPLTADDVLYTWHRILNPKTASGGSALLFALDLNRTRRVSDQEIIVALKSPQVDFPSFLTGREQSIVPNGFTDFAKPIGTGPFEFVSFTPGQRSVFKRNKNYWRHGEPYVDQLEQISIPDNTARFNAVRAGQVNAVENILPIDAKTNLTNRALHVYVTPSVATTAYYMKMQTAPFNIPEVREALRLAANRQQMVSSAYIGLGDIGNDLFGKGGTYYDSSIPQRPYDPDQARSLLAKVGKKNLQVTLNVSPAFVGQVESCQAYAQSAKAAGITVNVKQWDIPTFNSSVYNKAPFAATYWNFPTQLMMPYAFAKGAPFNETGYDNPVVQKLYAQSGATVDLGQRTKIFNEIQQHLWDDDGYVIWGFLKFTDATTSNVHGYVPHPYFNLGAFQFRTWWLS